MGTGGTLVWMTGDNGDCLCSPQFNGDMGPTKLGKIATRQLVGCKNTDDFNRAVEKLVKIHPLLDISEEELESGEFLQFDNLVKNHFHNEKDEDGIGSYFKKWNSDYLYIANNCLADIPTKDFNGKPIVLRAGYVTRLKFGKLDGKPAKITGVPPKEKTMSMTKMIAEYNPPVISLKDAVKEYEIKLTKDDLLIIDSLQNVLDSGVEECTLWYDKEHDRVVVNGKFKSIECTNVVVKKISNPGYMCMNIRDTKLHIQCSHWMFPCPDYKYSNIKRNLEKAICMVLHIGFCEVESFKTDILVPTHALTRDSSQEC